MYKCPLNPILIPTRIAVVTMKSSKMMIAECKFSMPPCTGLTTHDKMVIVSSVNGRCHPPDKKQSIDGYQRN